MKPVKTDYTNANFSKEGCADLPGTVYKYPDGKPGVETCWELTDEEFEQLKTTKRIYLYTMGATVPPMFLSTETQLLFEGGEQNENPEET